METSVDDVRMDAWTALVRTNACLLESLEADLMAERDLPLAWHEVMLTLSWHEDGRVRMQDLAHTMLLSKSGLTRLVDRMEAAGLVARQSCDADRRGTYAALTAKGRRELERSIPVFADSFRRHVRSVLSDAEAAQLLGLLEKLLVANGRSLRPACGPGSGEPAAGARTRVSG